MAWSVQKRDSGVSKIKDGLLGKNCNSTFPLQRRSVQVCVFMVYSSQLADFAA